MVFISDNELVWYLISTAMDAPNVPPGTRAHIERLDILLENDPLLRARCNALAQRLYTANMPAPHALFEVLTGYDHPQTEPH